MKTKNKIIFLKLKTLKISKVSMLPKIKKSYI